MRSPWDDDDPRSPEQRDRWSSGREREGDPREDERYDPHEALARGLDLPRGERRERLDVRDDSYQLRESEAHMLATVGAFRVVPVNDLRDSRGRTHDLHHGDLTALRASGLVQVVAPLQRGQRTEVVTLSERGRELLERHRRPGYEPIQEFYAGIGRPRELVHDAQVYKAFQRTAERLIARGDRVSRVVLEQELKRAYQRFLHARDRERGRTDGRPQRSREEVRAWAEAQGLPMVDGRVQFPDLRVEFVSNRGDRGFENVEVTTAHYRGAHASAKAAAGFTRFRAGSGRLGASGSRGRGGGSRGSGLAEELLR